MRIIMQRMSAENWGPKVGYEGLYEISDQGRVRSLDRTVIRPHPTTKKPFPYVIPGRVMKPMVRGKKNYLYVGLRNKNGHTAMLFVHRLVLETFVGPCPDGMVCCHNNGDPTDNRLENLRWDTHVSNQKDRIAHGTARRGENHSQAKITEHQARLLRSLASKPRYRRGLVHTLAAAWGVSKKTIYSVMYGHSWTHI